MNQHPDTYKLEKRAPAVMESIAQKLGNAVSGCSHPGSAPFYLHLGASVEKYSISLHVCMWKKKYCRKADVSQVPSAHNLLDIPAGDFFFVCSFPMANNIPQASPKNSSHDKVLVSQILSFAFAFVFILLAFLFSQSPASAVQYVAPVFKQHGMPASLKEGTSLLWGVLAQC